MMTGRVTVLHKGVSQAGTMTGQATRLHRGMIHPPAGTIRLPDLRGAVRLPEVEVREHPAAVNKILHCQNINCTSIT